MEQYEYPARHDDASAYWRWVGRQERKARKNQKSRFDVNDFLAHLEEQGMGWDSLDD